MKFKEMDDNVLLITAIFNIVLGALFIICRSASMPILFTVSGALLTVGGIVALFKKQFGDGLLCIVFGILMIIGAWIFTTVTIIIVGILLVGKGVLDIVRCINERSIIGIISAILSMIVGILLFVAVGNYFRSNGTDTRIVDILFIIVGILTAIGGIVGLITYFMNKKHGPKTVDVKDVESNDIKESE